MLELFVVVNLAFSMVGFFFIVRMWKEVKTRRDYYGEHFGIPRGAEVEPFYKEPPKQENPAMSMEQLSQLVALQLAGEKKKEPEPSADGDLSALLAAVAAQQERGRDA